MSPHETGIMIRRSAAFVLLILGLASVVATASATTPGPPCADSSARPTPIVNEPETIDQWRPIFEGTPEFQHARRSSLDMETELLRFIALIDLAESCYGHLLPEKERERITASLRRDEVVRTYNNSVLIPRIHVTDREIEEAYREHVSAFHRPESATVLEIFTWAPEGSPGRDEARRRLETTAETVLTADVFKTIAREHSDATSAYRGGSIGAVEKDGLTQPLRDTLFAGEDLGTTEILESEHGLYLFFVTRRTPAHTRSLEEKTPAIRRKLRLEGFEKVQRQDLAELTRRYDLRFMHLTEAMRDDSVVAVIGDERLTLAELGVDPATPTEELQSRIEKAAHRELFRRELERRSIGPSPSFQLRIEYRFFTEIMSRAAVTDEARKAFDHLLEKARTETPMPRMERWTFDELRVFPVSSQDQYFAIFKLLESDEYAAGNLTDLGHVIEEELELTSEIRHFEAVTQDSVAGLGPEIHTRLQRELDPGERSTPIHLEDEAAVVVIELESREVDSDASQRRHEEKARRQAAERFRAELAAALIGERAIQVRHPSPPTEDDEK
jgi:hypothetical protein